MDWMHGMGRAVVTSAEAGTPQPCGSGVPVFNQPLQVSTLRSACRANSALEQLNDKAVACFRVLLFNFRIEKGVCTQQPIERTCGWAVSHNGV